MKWETLWYGHHPVVIALLPWSWLFCWLVRLRQQAYRYGLWRSYSVSVPLITVGNLTVGGTGKTPLVVWISQLLRQHGFTPGIISRGYGGRAQCYPQIVDINSNSAEVGDEPVLLARQTGCKVAVAPRRLLAAKELVANYACDVLISDDGLQHYALRPDITIAVVDGKRRYGNGHCLPAGPLREPLSRLQDITFHVCKGEGFASEFAMQYQMHWLHQVADNMVKQPLTALSGQTVHALAGIGNPQHFFTQLREHGLNLHCHEFPDHYHYTPKDIQFADNFPILMTEKDAVKCQAFATPKLWYLPITVKLPTSFGTQLLNQLRRIHNG
jgi:tetraacyldisaccharide 4'-kinase